MPLSLIQKVAFGFAVALLLLLLVGVASYRVIDTLDANTARVAHTREVMASLERVIRLAGDAESGARGYLITGEDRYLQPYVAAAGSLLVEIDRLKRLTADDSEQQRRLATLDSLVHVRLERLAGTTASRRRLGFEAARDSVMTDRGLHTMDRIRDDALVMESLEARHLSTRIAAADAAARRTKTVILAGILFSVACAVAAILVIGRDLARRQELERALQRSRDSLEESVAARTAELRAVIDACPLAVIGIDPDGLVSLWNPAAERILGWREEDVLARPYPAVPEGGMEQFRSLVEKVDLGGAHAGIEVRRRRKDGTFVDLALYSATMRDGAGRVVGRMGVLADLTERKRLEEQLRQSQKMEAIGKLAGGVAHDFNNLLTAILGYGDLLNARLPGETGRRELAEIRRAAERAAALTRQMLAFSRQQVIQPRVLRLNEIVANLESMLGRLIGEDVHLITALDPAVGRVKADPLQMEQVVLNLAVNARDAMPRGGKLTIETSDATLDEGYAATHPDVAPGRYVLLAVSDTGVGMDEATRSRIFEPFFTTKEVGKGTGLGLATVYGIVKQSRGHMSVYSEPGQGATFKVYIPCVEEDATPAEAAPATVSSSGWETILVVEDEESLLKLVTEILRDAGYTVLPALGPDEATRLAAGHPGAVHLLLTDVVMPGMSGPALARRLAADRPEIRVLYMSGYTSNAIVHHGVLDPGVDYVEKPFTPVALTRRVREVLSAARIRV